MPRKLNSSAPIAARFSLFSLLLSKKVAERIQSSPFTMIIVSSCVWFLPSSCFCSFLVCLLSFFFLFLSRFFLCQSETWLLFSFSVGSCCHVVALLSSRVECAPDSSRWRPINSIGSVLRWMDDSCSHRSCRIRLASATGGSLRRPHCPPPSQSVDPCEYRSCRSASANRRAAQHRHG